MLELAPAVCPSGLPERAPRRRLAAAISADLLKVASGVDFLGSFAAAQAVQGRKKLGKRDPDTLSVADGSVAFGSQGRHG